MVPGTALLGGPKKAMAEKGDSVGGGKIILLFLKGDKLPPPSRVVGYHEPASEATPT